MFALAAATFVATTWISAPYGRYERPGWGPTLQSRVGWAVMESPAVIAFAAFYVSGEHPRDAGSVALLALWMSHYLHRAFVFPLRLKEKGKRMPWSVVAMGMTFNTYNAFINARSVATDASYGPPWLLDPRFLVGAAIFAAGYAVNRWADRVLVRLRAPGETGYKIPRGGLYELVACPNYLGEAVIWCGWALASWSWAGAAFAVYTLANLAPRARSHLGWYRATFPDFPRERRAMIPWVF
jgi:protein-S-isoprenylcysteine O-methyltransferase Ste14